MSDTGAVMDTGRDELGRFRKGAKIQGGDPLQKRILAFRRAALAAVSASEIKALFRELYKAAIEGDVNAAKLVLNYTIGKPEYNVNFSAEIERGPSITEMLTPMQRRLIAQRIIEETNDEINGRP